MAHRLTSQLILVPTNASVQRTEQAINQVIMLKQFVISVNPVFEALSGCRTDMLTNIRELCAAVNLDPVQTWIDTIINEDTTYAKQPLDLRNQRTYAVKSGVNGLLDVARQTYKEATEDAYQHITNLADQYGLPLDLKFENTRGFYIRIPATEIEDRQLPPVFINVFRKKQMIECQTLDLMKRNQKISDSHNEVLLMSDKAVHILIEQIRGHMSVLFKVCESIAMLDMLASFAQLATTHDYIRPQIKDALALKSLRHPIKEKVSNIKYIPNDVYATQQSRFQIITGCNMSGKSTYIRSIALVAVMAQIGSFVPAQYAAFPIFHQMFARISTDDSIESNVSTFAAEMREAAFILRNIDRRSLAIIDELGRGTSTRDGLAIAIAIAEALVDSRALVWFATHFRDLSAILAERSGVINLHLAVDMTNDQSMTMLYKIAEGAVQESHYGLALAKIVALPQAVYDTAKMVSDKLEQQMQKRKKTSSAVILERRRKLILNLKEHLVQAQNGAMEGEVLKQWLKELQKEFVLRMTGLEREAREAEEASDDEEEIAEERTVHEDIDSVDGTATNEQLMSDDDGGPVRTTNISTSRRRTAGDSHEYDGSAGIDDTMEE